MINAFDFVNALSLNIYNFIQINCRAVIYLD